MLSRPTLSAVSVAVLWFGVGVDSLDRVAIAQSPVKNKAAKAAIDAFKKESVERNKTYMSKYREAIETLGKYYKNDFNQARKVLRAKLIEAATAEKGKAGLDGVDEAKVITDLIKEYDATPPAPPVSATPPGPPTINELQAEIARLKRELARVPKSRRAMDEQQVMVWWRDFGKDKYRTLLYPGGEIGFMPLPDNPLKLRGKWKRTRDGIEIYWPHVQRREYWHLDKGGKTCVITYDGKNIGRGELLDVLYKLEELE